MGWTRRFVSALMLVAIAGLPVSATICAALCEPGVSAHADHAATPSDDADTLAASMHHDMAGCHAAASTDEPQMRSARPHDCGTHDGAQRDAESVLTTARHDASAPNAIALATFAPPMTSPARLLVTSSGTSPRLVSSASTPLVLRI